jgi:WD40 repeat protein
VQVPGYEIIEELGRGGMGVVYKALHVKLHRVVALKMILAGELAHPEERQRFRAEAEAVARLQHPNIVQLYEYGEAGGRPYFSLEFVSGGSLSDRLAGTPLPGAAAAELVEVLARAMHFAHEQGVIHRDLKPANVLIADSKGQSAIRNPQSAIKVADFGLAKRLDGGTGQTQSGAVIGSPSYMAPEQADGRSREVGPACDVYALGAILYECLTGRPPFRGATPIETILQVTIEEPVPPRTLRPGLPRDLETVTLKCLAKVPAKRYASAADLAEDLRRFRAGEPVAARPASVPERAVKWVRRNPARAGLYAVTALAGLALFGSGLWNNARLREAFSLATHERDLARGRLVRLTVASGTALYDQGEWLLALPWFAEALRQEQGDSIREAVHRLRLAAVLDHCPRLRSVWFHDGRVTDAAFAPDGRSAATAGDDGAARAWDVTRPAAPPRAVPVTGPVSRLAFSPDGGRLLVLADGVVTIHAMGGASPGKVTVRQPEAVTQAAWAADGRRVLTAGTDGTARAWDAVTGKVAPAVKHPGLSAVAMSADGTRLATGAADGSVQVWDAATGQRGPAFVAAGAVRVVAFSPAGDRLLAAGGPAARVWDLAGGPVRELAHHEEVSDAVFAPDGRAVATASADDSARVWDAATGQPLTPGLRHGSDVYHVTFAPDGRRVATGGDDDTARVWDAATGDPVTPPLPHCGAVTKAAFSPDGRLLLTSGADGTAKLWELRPHDAHASAKPARLPPVREAASSDGRVRVRVADDRTGRTAVIDWSPAVGPAPAPLRHGSRINSVALSPDGRRVLTASDDNTARVWDTATGEPVTPPLAHAGSVERAVFCRSGWAVLTAGRDGAAWLWDAATGEAITPMPRRATWVERALTGDPGTWDLPTDERPVEELEALARWLSGHRVDATGGLVPLGNDELRAAGERAQRQ